MTDVTVLPVRGDSPYDVIIGHGVVAELPRLLGAAPQRVALLYSAALSELAEQVAQVLVDNYDVLALGLPEGEAAKDAATAVECWEALGEAGFTRSDAVVTFGGGATTDLGGFVAATWLRGVRVIHIPTSVLGMVDAAVGGKTGINTGAGKNLVGVFHEPAGVICDLDLLATLPQVELASGLGEVVKCGFIADPTILELVESGASVAPDGPILRELIERSIKVKIDVVQADLKETGGVDEHPGRETLNYGHTLAHAIEKATNYQVRHGEAVAVGSCFVAEVARRAGLIDDALAERHRRVFGAVGLPTGFDGADFDELLATMRVDKKSRGSQLRLVVLHGLAEPRILSGPDDADLAAAYASLAAAP